MKKGMSKKDILIVILTVICLFLMIAIIYASKRNNEMISEMLESDSEIVASTVEETEKTFIDYVEFSEASSEKWIEFYNMGSDEIDLSGITIYLGNELIGTIDEGTVLAKQAYVAVDLKKNPGDAKVNTVFLKDKDGKDIACYLLPQILAGKSYGKVSSDAHDMAFMNPTKGKENSSDNIEYVAVDGIEFSVPSGFYTGSFTLTLKAGDGEKIYYTTDGTIPTTKSTEYTDSIAIKKPSSSDAVYAKMAFDYYKAKKYYGGSIDRGVVVNAIKVNGKGEITGQASQVYFVDMIRDASYKNIPIISITVNPDDMFGYENGIYMTGKGYDDALIAGEDSARNHANYLSGEKKVCNITYFEPTKGISMETDGTIGIHYNSEVTSVQKAFKLTLDGSIWKYTGSSLLDYIDGNYELIIQQNLDDENIKMREYLANSFVADSAVGAYEMTPVIVFLDGEYWGLYMMKAPYDTKYFSKNYGVSEDDLNIRKYYFGVYNRSFKEVIDFIETNDMSNDENYKKVQEMMDIDSYLTYVCANVYIGNSNFSSTRTSTWKTNSTEGTGYSDGRWRWLMSFTADSMNSSRKQNYTINTFLQPGLRGDRTFQSLLMNKDFCNRMVYIMEKLAKENFSQDNCTKVIDYYEGLLKKPAIDSHSRFYGSYSDTAYKTEVGYIRTFFSMRSEYILQYTRELAEKGGDLETVDRLQAAGLGQEQDEDEALVGASTEGDEEGTGEENTDTNAKDTAGNAENNDAPGEGDSKDG